MQNVPKLKIVQCNALNIDTITFEMSVVDTTNDDTTLIICEI